MLGVEFHVSNGEAFNSVRAVADFGKLSELHPPEGLEPRVIKSVHCEELPVMYKR